MCLFGLGLMYKQPEWRRNNVLCQEMQPGGKCFKAPRWRGTDDAWSLIMMPGAEAGLLKKTPMKVFGSFYCLSERTEFPRQHGELSNTLGRNLNALSPQPLSPLCGCALTWARARVSSVRDSRCRGSGGCGLCWYKTRAPGPDRGARLVHNGLEVGGWENHVSGAALRELRSA